MLKEGKSRDKMDRWNSNVVKTVRVLLPAPFSRPQIYFAKNGNAIHGQHTLMEILNDLREREKFPPHIFIWNDENYSDEFMLVINKFPEDNSIPLPDPVRVRQCAMESISKNRDGTPKRDSGGDYLLKKALNGRATLATDIGVTGSQANKRGNCLDDDGSGNHHSKPPMLKFTYEYSDILRSCSLVASSPVLKPSWIPVVKSSTRLMVTLSTLLNFLAL